MGDITDSIEQSFREASPRSAEEFERGREFMPGVAKGAYFYPPYPLVMERGDGCYLHDIEGRRYVDFHNHHTVQILGHRHPAIVEAVNQQMERGIAFGAPIGTETDLAEEICRRVESIERVRFCTSGTEATLHAIRLARGFRGRSKIAKFEGGYHGSHDAVEVSVSPPLDRAGPDTAPYSVPTAGGISPSAIDEVIVLPYNDTAAVERIVSTHAEQLSCVILDPKAGILPVSDEFIRAVREITRKHDVLMILDEIVAFRLGPSGLQGAYNVQPDLTTYGKIVGGGFPLAALGGRTDIMNLFDPTDGPTGFFQSGTYSAHPIAIVAGLAMLRELTPAAFERLNRLAECLCSGLREVIEQRGVAAQVVNLGSVFSIAFTGHELKSYRQLATSDGAMAHRMHLALLEEGYLMSHTMGMNSLSLAMDKSHIDGLIAAFDRALKRAGAA